MQGGRKGDIKIPYMDSTHVDNIGRGGGGGGGEEWRHLAEFHPR